MKTMRFEICSDRLDLWPVRSADVNGLHALWTSPSVRRFLWDDVIIPPNKTLEIITKSEELFREQGLGGWCARLSGRTRMIGFGGFWYFRNAPELELLFGADWKAKGDTNPHNNIAEAHIIVTQLKANGHYS